jgi:hypothetical protein
MVSIRESQPSPSTQSRSSRSPKAPWPTAVKEILDGDEYVATVEHVTGKREGRELNVDVCTLYRGRDEKIVEWHILPIDVAASDQFGRSTLLR